MDVRVGLWRKLSAEELMLLNCGVGEDSWECLGLKEIQPVHSKGDQPWVFFGRTDAKAETPILWPPHAESWFIGKDSDAGRDWGQEEKGTTEDEMSVWHHRLEVREFEWNPGVGDGQGGLACCNSWGHNESGMTERLNWLNWTDGVHVHSAIFLNHKEVGSNSKASHRRESREIISSEVRDAGWDTRWYHIISPLRVKVRWIQLNLLPRDRGSQT